MSLHKSLKNRGKHVRSRNVLTRDERIARLQKEERWSEEKSVFGLPKVRVTIKAPRRARKEEAKPAATTEGAPAAEASEKASPKQ